MSTKGQVTELVGESKALRVGLVIAYCHLLCMPKPLNSADLCPIPHWLCDINCMSDYDEYNEQVLRFRELLTALNAVLDDLARADLDSWAEMKQRLPLAQPRADDLLMVRQTTEELKRMGDTLIRILVKYE
jgi:hypothetical protein